MTSTSVKEMVDKLRVPLLAVSGAEEALRLEEKDLAELRAIGKYLLHTSYMTEAMYKGFQEQIKAIFKKTSLYPDFKKGYVTGYKEPWEQEF